jgi:hypothetical protein
VVAFLGIAAAVSCASLQPDFSRTVALEAEGVRQGKIDAVVAQIEVKARAESKQKVLHALQAGYYHLFLGDYAKSREFLQLAEAGIIAYERAAVISAADAAALAQSLLTSDLELPYKGDGFEKVMLNTLLAMDYLFLGDLEGSAVEIRRADLRQKQELDAHQKELLRLEKEKKDKNVNGESETSLLKQYDVLDEYASGVVSSFQNGFTYFLSGLVYELNKDPNNAYIDYKKSFNLYRNRSTLEKLWELARRMAFRDEAEKWRALAKESYGLDLGTGGKAEGAAAAKQAELIVIYFAGQVPRKTQAKLSLPISGQIMSVAFPFFDPQGLSRRTEGIDIAVNGTVRGRTDSVLDFVPIVTKAMKEKVPGMAIRQILRVLAKHEVNKTAEKELGILGKWGANLINWATEKADLRGWYELPRAIHVLRARVEPGQAQTIGWQSTGDAFEGRASDGLKVDLQAGHTTIVFIVGLAGVPAVYSKTF